MFLRKVGKGHISMLGLMKQDDADFGMIGNRHVCVVVVRTWRSRGPECFTLCPTNILLGQDFLTMNPRRPHGDWVPTKDIV